MEGTLEEEVISINAIYGDDTLRKSLEEADLFVLNLPTIKVSLSIKFPDSYPEEAPQILGPSSSGLLVRKGQASETASRASNVLSQVFQPGEPCIFALIEGVLDSTETSELSNLTNQSGQLSSLEEAERETKNTAEAGEYEEVVEPPSWSSSKTITEKKSIFVAHVCSVRTPRYARYCIGHLIDNDKKISKATHNISAWRIRDPGNGDIKYQDCDDDGEDAAGARLLHLLQIMDIWNVVVIVSRWYGGIKLGADRFRIINAVAKESITNHAIQHPSK